MSRILPLIILAVLAFFPLAAQTGDTAAVRPMTDTTAVMMPPDSTLMKKDSVIHYIPIPELGSIEPFKDPSLSITTSDITFLEYRSLYDLFSRSQGVFMRDLASPGQPNQLLINGIDERNIAVMVDGVPYNDHNTGSFNLWNIPAESIERIEFITGSSAMFYDGRSAGGVINIVTKNFNNNRAITALRFSQGTASYNQTDASFAQNIANGINLSFALSHYGFGSDKEYQFYRGRFKNSNDDAWMLRSKLRYNVTDWFGLSFAYTYDRSWTGLHGGVNYSTTRRLFDGLTANVTDLESYQKLYNSHYNLTAAFYPLQDSTLLTSFTFYSFDRLREFRNEENRSLDSDSLITKRDLASVGRGLKLMLMSQYSDLRVIGYADLARIQSEDIITAGVKAEILPQAFITVTPFVTVKNYQRQFIANGGADAVLKLSDSFRFFGGIAQNIINDNPVTTGPTIVPTSSALFSAAERQKEMFTVLEAGARLDLPALSANITLRHLEQYDPIVFDTITFVNSSSYYSPVKYQVDAVSAGFHLTVGEFHLEGNASYLKYPSIVRDSIPLTLFPELTANGSIYFKGFLANGALDLKFGLRGSFYSKQTGMRPYDQYGVWIPSTQLTYGPGGSVDLFAIGKIGDAYVHIIWENLAGNEYLLAPVYPTYERNIRFGVTWEFLD